VASAENVRAGAAHEAVEGGGGGGAKVGSRMRLTSIGPSLHETIKSHRKPPLHNAVNQQSCKRKVEGCKVTRTATKEQLLKKFGYGYNFDRELYLNRTLKKAFSVEFIEDRSEEEIEKAIQEPAVGRWRFFFNGSLSSAAENELANLLG
jgi:hypothetical protein